MQLWRWEGKGLNKGNCCTNGDEINRFIVDPNELPNALQTRSFCSDRFAFYVAYFFRVRCGKKNDKHDMNVLVSSIKLI